MFTITTQKNYCEDKSVMRILISSGGTTVPIDAVRSITNSSSGRFGAELASAALTAGMEVIYLVSANGQSPFCQHIDYYKNNHWENNFQKLKALYEFGEKYSKYYREYRYRNFTEYHEKLKALVEMEKPDITMLTAAVSDYLIDNYTDRKVRSDEELTINLQPAPKIIHAVKDWHSETFLVGFKLLVNATDAGLILAASRSLKQHQSDLVIANDLFSLRQGRHEVIMVEKDGSFQKHTHDIANTIIIRCLQR
jgi:phosphopantothenoylcysteine synthetase/decarboxylase